MQTFQVMIDHFTGYDIVYNILIRMASILKKCLSLIIVNRHIIVFSRMEVNTFLVCRIMSG